MFSASLERLGKAWRERLDAVPGYQVVPDGEMFRTSFLDSFLFTSEYRAAQVLKGRLLEEHRGTTPEELFSGDEVETPCGPAFRIRSSHPLEGQLPSPAEVKARLQADLTLVEGIGPATERLLRSRGYATIRDLLPHRRFGGAAQRCLEVLDSADPREVMEWVARWYPRSHPTLLRTACLHRGWDPLFLDIETMGLFSRPIILIGVGKVSRGRLEVDQYLLRDIREEPAALAAAFASGEEDRTALVTYNGKTFDVPFLSARAVYYGMPPPFDLLHYDLLHFSRRRWKGDFPDFRLATLERHLFGVTREMDVPGALVPEFYDAYQRSGNPGPLLPVVLHNRQDVVSLALLFYRMLSEGYGGS